MKILIPVICFGKSGGDRVLSKIADELIFLGNQVEFLCPEGSSQPYYPTLAKINWVDRYGHLYQQQDHKPLKNENFFSIQTKLTRALKKIPHESYDVIFANQSLTVLPIIRNGLIGKTLYYIQAYEPELYYVMGGVKNKILGILSETTYRKNIYKVVNSDLYKQYRKLTASNVVYPGVDFSLFYPKKITPTANNRQDKIIIGTVGRLERYKGNTYVLEGFRLIRQKYHNAELHIAFGNSSDYKDFEGVFCFQPNGDKALGDFYRSLNYYFCAAYVQVGSFHYPLVEAMSCGVPVITTQCYPTDINNAWLTHVCDVAGIFDQFELAFANPVLKEIKIQKAIIDTKQFDWKETGKQLNILITSLINSKQNE